MASLRIPSPWASRIIFRSPMHTKTRNSLAALLCALAMAPAKAAPAIDYAREERWAQEVVPSIVIGDAVWLSTPARAKVLAILTEPTSAAKVGVIVVHGLGVHPDFAMIGSVRTRLAEAGYVTLSVQMPVLAASATRADYSVALPEAADRIAAAIAYLRNREITKIAIVAHSMGATMVDAYLARTDAARIDAWVPVGMLVNFSIRPAEPVADIVAESDLPEVVAAMPLRGARLSRDGCSRQITITGADHYFEARQKELADAIVAFLDRVVSMRC